MGAAQFMPSSYRNFAVSAASSGPATCGNNWGDIFTSIANHPYTHGWDASPPERDVRPPDGTVVRQADSSSITTVGALPAGLTPTRRCRPDAGGTGERNAAGRQRLAHRLPKLLRDHTP
jgi:membrane-bound lytic murein transglycosylase B